MFFSKVFAGYRLNGTFVRTFSPYLRIETGSVSYLLESCDAYLLDSERGKNFVWTSKKNLTSPSLCVLQKCTHQTWIVLVPLK